MTLRTPRRRISPRAKRRYRAIKDFLRRALGSSSQPDIKINSSIAINVTDLKHKIVGLEQQLTEVNKHCRELVCLESSSRKESQTQVSTDGRQDLDVLKEQSEITSTKRVHLHGDETKLLYKTSESFYRKSDDSDSISKVYHDPKRNDLRPSDEMAAQSYVDETKIKKKKSKLDKRMNAVDGIHHNLRKHKARSTYENFASSYGATTSYHSLNEPRVGRRRCTDYPGHSFEGHYMKQHEYVDPIAEEVRPKNTSRKNSPQRYQEPYEGKHRRRSKKNTSRELDQEFIADIIKRQYRPIRMFGQRESGVSQFSAPICRDQEYPIRENILEGSDLCSCCFDGRKNHRNDYEYGINDIRSICDTRLYSAMPPTRHKHHRKHTDNYNDSNQYDLVPVKEKSSPKTKRKFTGDAMIPYGYKEVPPSPRSHRPRLNLKAQYYNEFEEYMLHRRQRNGSPKRYKKKHYEHIPESCVDESTEAVVTNKEKRKTNIVKSVQNETHIQQDVATTTSSLQSPIYSNAPANVPDSILNKTQETDSSTDKTDKALNEIKDILQSFLQEIKKETTVSQCDNSEINAKVTEKSLNEFRIESAKLNSSMIPNSGHNMNNYTLPQCGLSAPFMPPFTNPCCYPILPVCPMNCVQNGYAMPSQSFTCASCANNAKEEVLNKTTSPNESTNNVKNTNETDHLIKEIYKFVAQSPINARRKEFREMPKNESTEDGTQGKMTSRSVGGCSKFSRHDAQVETQKIRCQSKSCEAIGSRFLTDTTYNTRTNPSYSDSILERLSLEAATGSESIDSSESTTIKKVKKNKFTKVLRSFGLFKKKRDVIEELSESGSTIEVEVKAKKAPFRQEMMSYMMHEQEYYNRPPQYGHGFGYHPVCPDHLSHVNPMQAQYHPCHPPEMSYHHEQTAPGYRSPHMPSAPPYPNPYQAHHTHDQPQVPLCLKEIEVKSIGTQSDRKMNLFGKFTKKMQGPAFTIPRNQVVEDLQNNAPETTNDKPNLFNWKAQQKAALPFAMTRGKPQPIQLGKDKPALWSWKTLQAKVNQLDQPNSFTYETQKKLAQGDIKMRNAMLKKMFYKRNPFSPRNLIVRTLLGKDKSSYGEPPMMYRPRMFY